MICDGWSVDTVESARARRVVGRVGPRVNNTHPRARPEPASGAAIDRRPSCPVRRPPVRGWSEFGQSRPSAFGIRLFRFREGRRSEFAVPTSERTER